ncbi:MAG: hypothetical protein LBE33_05680 [Zoogloeaceae bacterium]|jgi:hypothetical protein|nr:hypothetical protein [Zoogloeaceae bacterium]
MMKRGGWRAVLSGLVFLAAWPCGAAQVTLSLGSIHHAVFEAEDVTVAFDAAHQGEADIRFGRLKIADTEYRALRLHCSGFYFDGRRLDCPRGALHRQDERGRNRPALPFSFAWRADDGFLDFSLRDVDAIAFSPLVKRLRSWQPQGKFDLAVTVEGGRARLGLAVRDLEFATREGDLAGKGIAFSLDAAAERDSGGGWRWNARLDWPRGELYRAPWRRLAGVRMEAEGTLDEKALGIDLARLEIAGLGSVTASVRWDREQGEATDGGFITDRIDLSAAMRDWLQPWLASLDFPVWQVAGHGRLSAEWRGRKLWRFYAGLEDARLADDTNYLELNDVNAHIPWEATAATEAEFSIGSGRFGDLPLGKFELPIRIEGNGARVTNVAAPLLDGRLLIGDLHLANGKSGWRGEFAGGIEDVSMPKLSRALKLPEMAGSLTARIPRIAYRPGLLRLDGALSIAVFDGGIIVHQLRLTEPFSAERRFLAEVTARNLDLGMLTRTFSFGAIEGRFDADLHDLEMRGWHPLRFEARIESSEGEYPRQLSLGALEDITALGERGRPGALARAPERAGFSLGYERIGFSCALKDGVCLLDGVEREGDGVVMMRGRGIPSVSIIGYNRHIDWEALVARIRETISGRSGVVIE